MERVAVFVDAGYFWVQASHILYGEKRPREEVALNESLMRECLLREVERQFPGIPLLRVYWYDALGKDNSPSWHHKIISRLDDFKMRYGTINSFGHQKGVDGLLLADLLALAQNKAINSALLISGDADLAPGVNAAQTLGLRIHRLEMSGSDASSPVLCEEVDRNVIWAAEEIKNFISAPPPRAEICKDNDNAEQDLEVQPACSHLDGIFEKIAKEFVEGLDAQEREDVGKNLSIPYEIDKRLLYQGKTALGARLDEEEKKVLRSLVQQMLREEHQ